MLKIHRIINTLFSSNTYVLYEEESSSAWLVDCGDVAPIIHWCEENRKIIEGVFLTHCHFDHIYGLNELYAYNPLLKVYTSSNGAVALVSPRFNLSLYHEQPFIYVGQCFILQDEDKLLPFKKDSDITFTVVYDVKPVFELPQYTRLEINVPEIEVTEKDIDSDVENLRNQNAIIKNKSGKAENGNIATINYVEIDENGNEIESTKRNDFTFTIGTGYNFYKLDNDVIGMKKDEEKTVEKSYTEEDNIPGYAGKTVKLSIKLTELKERELPEVDDEFAQDIKDEYKTVKDMRAGIRKDLEKKAEDAMKTEKEDAVVKAIAEKTSFTIPQSMIQAELDSRWRNLIRSSSISEDQLLKFLEMQGETKESFQNGWKDEVTAMLRSQLVLDAIRDKENFEISEEDLNAECEKQLKNVPESEKESYKEIIKDNMQFEKVIPFLLENNTFKSESKVSYKEYTEPKPEKD